MWPSIGQQNLTYPICEFLIAEGEWQALLFSIRYDTR